MIDKEISENLTKLKVVQDDLEVVFEIESIELKDQLEDHKPKEGLDRVNELLSSNQYKVDELNIEIDRLTNHSDGIDYMVAVGSGILAGFIDMFWVGEFSLERGKDWSTEKVNNFVKKIAEWKGYKGDDLPGAIRHLENNFGAASDSNTSDFGGGLQHHLRDFAHHPTPVGLVFSMLTQFTGKSYGTDKLGIFKIVEVKNTALIGEDLPQKFLYGVVQWFFHMVSDMAGSSSSPGAGTGLPGPLLSLAKELSALPFFKDIKIGDTGLSVWISKLFNGTLLAKRDEAGKIVEPFRFDLRTEIGVGYEIGRQAIPVVLNECIVRGFYFIRRLAAEIKEKEIRRVDELKQVDWKHVLPFKNRTIVRMLTISTGTFTAIDLGDAAIRAGIKSGGNQALFLKEFVLRVNFVGVGRFAIAVGSDVGMGLKKGKLENERMALHSQQLHLMNAKIIYLQADAWIEAETTEMTINEVLGKMETTTQFFVESWNANRQSMKSIGEYRQGIQKHNPGLIAEISDILKWG
ncbi:hypothetical protein [Sporosarcina sp. FA9]|uniref:hypothetical protein n=1 Tax=Sporosarcina sp. FA9 TaxID=3413030 RepID=UPI003F65E6FD